MIHPQDEQSLQRLLGVETPPKSVLDEYRIRLALFHRDGHSGPLGTIALIDLVRSQGLKPPVIPKDKTVVDWRTVATDGSVYVDVPMFGDLKRGTYCGMGTHGVLHVKFPGDEMVYECCPPAVKLVPPEDANPEPLEPEAVLTAEGAAAMLADWQKVEAGTAVWFDWQGDIVPGKYCGIDEKASPRMPHALVSIEGKEEPVSVYAGAVTLT